jgi:hypothetical protein
MKNQQYMVQDPYVQVGVVKNERLVAILAEGQK